MDDDDDDAHIASYNDQQELQHLYSEESQGIGTEREGQQVNQGGEGEVDEDDDGEGEDGYGDEDEDESKGDEEEEEEEEEAVDGVDFDENNEDEKEEDEDEAHQFLLGQGDNTAGDFSLHMNGSSSSNGGLASPAPGLVSLLPSQREQDHHLQTPGRGRGQQHQVQAGDGKPSARDDWTEPATHALLESWGEKYLQLNKGNLKQEDWEEVASAVSAVSKAHKTDVQCKNRLDTLKKKYKVEKQKQSAIGSSDSKWPFYKRLNELLSTTMKHVGIPGAVDAGKPVTAYAVDARGQHFDRSRRSEAHGMKEHHNVSTTVSKSKGSPDMTYSSPPQNASRSDGTQSRNRKRKAAGADGTAFKTLAKAITRFGEIYEKMEHSKQQQMMDLEKIRMEFTRDLELKRMQLFMQTQVEVAKMKHSTHDTDTTVSNLSE